MESSIEKIVARYRTHPKLPVALDIETTGLNPRASKIVSIQLLQGEGRAVVLDMRTRGDGALLAPLFDGTLLIVGHNLKFDLSFLLEHYGIRAARVFDTMLAEQVIYGSETGKGYGLQQVADRRGGNAGQPLDKTTREFFYDLDTRGAWGEPFPARVREYMGNDVQVLLPILKQQIKELAARLLTPTAQLEFALVPVMVEMEHNGVHIDVAGWRSFIQEKHTQAEAYKEQVIALLGPAILQARGLRLDTAMEQYRAWEDMREGYLEQIKTQWAALPEASRAGGWGTFKISRLSAWRQCNPTPKRPKHDGEVNINSNEQIMDALVELGIAVPMKRKKGASTETKSVDEESLKAIEHQHAGIALLRRYRKEEKFVKSYGEELLREQDASTGRFHFAYNQIVSTGRMSASRIQQIPARGEGARLRQNVTAEQGYKLVIKDFNAAEMRILAELSRDEGLISIFTEGQDIHSSIARDLFALSDDVDPKAMQATDDQGRAMGKTYRDIAKTVEYSAVYGTGPRRLAQVVGCDLATARAILTKFLAAYPGVEAYLARVKQNAVTMGESRTLGGRARYYTVPTKPTNGADVREWKGTIATIERAAGNAPIQGSNADITKAAAVALYTSLCAKHLLCTVKLVGLIHDEIVLEVREDYAEQAGEMLATAMETGWNQYVKSVPMGPRDYTVSECWEH